MRLLDGRIPRICTDAQLWWALGKGDGQMETEPYSDQLLEALRQLRARAIETEGAEPNSQELGNIGDTLSITLKWFATKRPPPTPPGAGLKELAEYTGKYADALKQEAELVGALQAISRDFSVEAIDNAIRIVEKLT
jgi:hypothetical protein